MVGSEPGASKSNSLQELPSRPIPKSNSQDMWGDVGIVPRSTSAAGDLNRVGRRIEEGPILVGICAMDQKARSKPMTEMLNRLTSFTAGELIEFKVVYFGNDTLLNEPVEQQGQSGPLAVPQRGSCTSSAYWRAWRLTGVYAGSGRRTLPGGEAGHRAPRYCLGCSS